MRQLSTWFGAVSAAALLASCSGGSTGSWSSLPGGDNPGSTFRAMQRAGGISIVPRSELPKGRVKLEGRRAPATALKGIYVGDFDASSVLGYPKNNASNGPPICMVSGVKNVNNLATDTLGDLIVPNSFAGVNVYRGPQMCGPLTATITDTYGQASDAAAVNALTGNIVVGNILGPGFVVLCSISAGCHELTPPSSGFGESYGVAMDNSGNCWASSLNAAFTAPILTEWVGCAGTGTNASGFVNAHPGGLDVDNKGNIVSIDFGGSSGTNLWTYSGCPSCSPLQESPLTNGSAVFGHIGKQGQRLVVGNYAAIQVDIYSYSPTTLTYYYSFDNGLGPSGDVEGAAYSPSSKK